jgi:hypothetical protein
MAPHAVPKEKKTFPWHGHHLCLNTDTRGIFKIYLSAQTSRLKIKIKYASVILCFESLWMPFFHFNNCFLKLKLV